MWDLCWDTRDNSASAPVRLAGCHAENVWKYDDSTMRITHVKSDKCLVSPNHAGECVMRIVESQSCRRVFAERMLLLYSDLN